MSWLKKLPRWIRPPAKVRNVIDKLKIKDIIPPLPNLDDVKTVLSGGIPNPFRHLEAKLFTKPTPAAINNAAVAAGPAQSPLPQATNQSNDLKILAIVAVVIVVVVLLFKRR